jgi:hypothetical protein
MTGFFCSGTMDHGLSVSGRTSVRVGAELYMGVVSKRDRPGGVAPGRSGIVDPMSARASRVLDALVDVPLSLEPVLGWRDWRLTWVDGELRLQAMASPDTWAPHEAPSARCLISGHPETPGAWCTCGYHSACSVEALAGAGVFGRGVSVIGAIAMWGTVIEHAQGARSTHAYPARLRLVCSPCLRTGSIVDPVTVVPTSPLLPLCDRHWRSQGEGHLSARAVEAELLANYGVELLPRPPLPRHRLPFAGRRSWRTLGKVLTSIRHRAADPIPGRTVRSAHPYVGDA